MITDSELSEFQSLADAASLGPWGFVYDGSSTWSIGLSTNPQDDQVCSIWFRDEDTAMSNVAFIAASRTMVPRLLEGVRGLNLLVLKYIEQADTAKQNHKKVILTVEDLRKQLAEAREEIQTLKNKTTWKWGSSAGRQDGI